MIGSMPRTKMNNLPNSPISSRTRGHLLAAEGKCKKVVIDHTAKQTRKQAIKRKAVNGSTPSDTTIKPKPIIQVSQSDEQIHSIESNCGNLSPANVTEVPSGKKIKKSTPKLSASAGRCTKGRRGKKANKFANTSNDTGETKTIGTDLASSNECAPIDNCPICMCPIENLKILSKCNHKFCTECIVKCFEKMNPACPVCGEIYGIITGNQPENGIMNSYLNKSLRLPSYEKYGTIVITYQFPDGVQTDKHPHPNKPFYGTFRQAYLPDNAEGRLVAKLLRRAFDSRLVFTVGQSATTGLDDQVIWNDIHHKTNPFGGEHHFGYPDATYLRRVQEELAVKGIK